MDVLIPLSMDSTLIGFSINSGIVTGPDMLDPDVTSFVLSNDDGMFYKFQPFLLLFTISCLL